MPLSKGQANGEDPIGWVLSEHDRQPQKPLVISQAQRARHLYLLGATGSGKTNLILQLLGQDFREGRTVAIIDLRGDLVDRAILRIASLESPDLAPNVLLLDLRDPDRIVGFNPLRGSADPHSRAYLVLDAMRSHSESWGIQLEETLRNSLIALAEADLSLLELELLLTQRVFRDDIVHRSQDPSVTSFFDRYNSLSTERQQTWFLPVLNKVTPLLGIPRLRLLFGSPNSIDFKQALDTPGKIILISLGVDRFHSAARLIGSLIIGSIESAVMTRVDTHESRRNRVNLYVDEFETMATEAFSSIVAEGRRFGLSLTLSHQNLSQVSVGLRSCLRSNIASQLYFATGSIDAWELKRELRFGDDEDGVKLLQTLPVGEAVLNKRPDDPVLVRINESKDPLPRPDVVREFVNRVHEAIGTADAADVTLQIRNRAKSSASASTIDSDQPIEHKRVPSKKGGRSL